MTIALVGAHAIMVPDCSSAASHPAIAVCVPVRDERALLSRLLDALDRQKGVDPRRIHACFYFDGCEDGGDALVRRRTPMMASRVTIASGERASDPNAGRARAAAVALGEERLRYERDAVLLTTDADSVPRADWIATAYRALETADLVAGRVVREDGERDCSQARIEAYYDRLYALRRAIDPVVWEPGRGHHFASGANLGFRARAYRALGGFAHLAHGEDARIVDDAARAGLRVRRDPAMVVETSSRRNGRALGGLASTLRALDRDATRAQFAHPADAAWQWRRQARARFAFARLGHLAVRAELAALLALTPDHVLGVARDCPNAEAFAMRIVPCMSGGERMVPLGVAERALALLERARHERAA